MPCLCLFQMEHNKVKVERKFRVNTAALVDLKAALYHKQQQVKKEKQVTQDASVAASREVSEKTSSIWKSVSVDDKKIKRKVDAHRTRQNEKRDQGKELSAQEEEELAKSRCALEAKAALYDRLREGVGLREELEGEDGEENETRFMVDFTKKIWQEQQSSEKSHKDHTETEKGLDEVTSSSEAPTEDEGWVDFVDSLGRSRRCLKKDLAHYQSVDDQLVADRSPSPDLLSDDMRRERERKKWEEQAEQEAGLVEPVGPVHYQAVRGGEVRSHGIGYYAFSTDVAKRKEQMELLDKLRKQTHTQKEKRQKFQEKRKALLEARLTKVRQRKLKQQGVEDSEMSASGIADFETKDSEGDRTEGDGKGAATTPDLSSDISSLLSEVKEQSRAEQEKEAEEKRASHVRPWDKGKVMDPIRKRKQELREERLTEFAPPSFYSESAQLEKPSPTKKTKTDDDDVLASTSESQDTTRRPEPAVITPTVPTTSVATYSYPPPAFPGAQFPPFPPPPFTALPPGHYPPPPPHAFVPPPYPPGVTFPPPPQGPYSGYNVPYSYMRPPPPPPGVPPSPAEAGSQTHTDR